ncbi:MAG: carbon-nitrogen hydrolase family protein [Myxococcota bacterium]
MKYLAAVVQLRTTDDPVASMASAEVLVAEAAGRGARLVALPEAVPFMGPEHLKRGLAQDLDGPWCAAFSQWAETHRIHLLAGSIFERSPDGRVFNTSTLWSPEGRRLAVYRKVHLFDAEVGDGRSYKESVGTAPGDRGVVVSTSLGSLGLSICYDLRFPGMYRRMAALGADLVFAPSAFTVPTGQLHWEVLLRARAIENQCFMVAPAQEGAHGPKRRTWGRSLIVGPSGELLTCRPTGVGLAYAEIDLEERRHWAKRLPTTGHERDIPIERLD